MQDDDICSTRAANWRQEGPEAISRGLEPQVNQSSVNLSRADQAPLDESLWLAMNAWG
jgi:hypothetical protein